MKPSSIEWSNIKQTWQSCFRESRGRMSIVSWASPLSSRVDLSGVGLCIYQLPLASASTCAALDLKLSTAQIGGLTTGYLLLRYGVWSQAIHCLNRNWLFCLEGWREAKLPGSTLLKKISKGLITPSWLSGRLVFVVIFIFERCCHKVFPEGSAIN